MAFGDNQRMAFAYRVTIEKGHGGGGFAQQFHFRIQVAERTILGNLIFLFVVGFVEALVLVDFAVLVCKNTFVRQNNVSLICGLLVYKMRTETLAFQITADSKIGCTCGF